VRSILRSVLPNETLTARVTGSVLGFPELTQEFVYFNRTDVQKAIHAPNVNWDICSDIRVYGGTGRDQSTPSMLSVMPGVIERSERVVVVHGLADMILLSEGTRIAIQNMTWSGSQGFQSPIEAESFTVPGFGVYGNAHSERNLTCGSFFDDHRQDDINS
jgi:carboxypeptidase D